MLPVLTSWPHFTRISKHSTIQSCFVFCSARLQEFHDSGGAHSAFYFVSHRQQAVTTLHKHTAFFFGKPQPSCAISTHDHSDSSRSLLEILKPHHILRCSRVGKSRIPGRTVNSTHPMMSWGLSFTPNAPAPRALVGTSGFALIRCCCRSFFQVAREPCKRFRRRAIFQRLVLACQWSH